MKNEVNRYGSVLISNIQFGKVCSRKMCRTLYRNPQKLIFIFFFFFFFFFFIIEQQLILVKSVILHFQRDKYIFLC